MNWVVYKRTNTLNKKIYIGVTGKTLEERWYFEIKSATAVKDLILKCQAIKQDILINQTKFRIKKLVRLEKKLLKVKKTIAYDIYLNLERPEIWVSEVLEDHGDDVVGALLAEKRFIKAFRSNDPKIGYNRSEGGEIPPWINIDDVIKFCKPYVK